MSENQCCNHPPERQRSVTRMSHAHTVWQCLEANRELYLKRMLLESSGKFPSAVRAIEEQIAGNLEGAEVFEQGIAQSFAAEADPETPVTEEPKPEVSPP